MFTYTVTKVEPHQITVSFPDTSWAEVPVYEGETQETIDTRVATFYFPVEEGFDSVEKVPFKEGKSYTTNPVDHKPVGPEVSEPVDKTKEIVTYQQLRNENYPSASAQCYAMYQARRGNSQPLADLDAAITAVDATYPADMEPITRAEYEALAEEASVL